MSEAHAHEEGEQPKSHRRSRGHDHGGGGGHEEAHEGAPEWLISFADNVMLIMGFFVILLAMNLKAPTSGGIGGDKHNPAGKIEGAELGSATPQMLDLALSIREAFHNPVNPNSDNPSEAALRNRLYQLRGESHRKQAGPKGHEHDVESVRPGEYTAPFGTVPFDRGSAELNDAARTRIGVIAERARGRTLVVEVRGHVSAAEAHRRSDPGMRLAFDRALAVAGELARHGVDWWQLRLLACGDHERVTAFPTGPDEDKVNSRVEVVITDEVVPDAVPTQPGEAQGSDRWP